VNFNLEMTGISFECKEQVHGLINNKRYNYKRTIARILAENSKGNILHLDVDHVPRSPDAFVAYDWLLLVQVGISGPRGLITIMAGIDCELIKRHTGFTFNSLLTLCDNMACVIEPKYGFVTVAPRDRMPNGYAMGLASGGPPGGDDLIWDANAWRGVWRQYDTKLRNVHALNFLNSAHLNQKGNMILKDWIESNPTHGILERWDRNLLLWSLKDELDWPNNLKWDSENILAVREELKINQCFLWQDYFSTKVPSLKEP
jgi:hypothetical protein